MNMKGLYLILLSFLFGCNLPDMQTGKEVSYYFDQPAQIWEETLPLGNGRIGMMPDGGIERENVCLLYTSRWKAQSFGAGSVRFNTSTSICNSMGEAFFPVTVNVPLYLPAFAD